MGLNGSPTYAVTFDNVRVPLSNTIGAEGRGLQQTLATLSKGRVSIGALALGIAQAAYEAALAYAQERKTFGARSPTIRRSSSCSPTWLPRSRPRA